ncbi:unnamed protein product [Closterium sp. NIES-65]|nr:unnamed protein product [Closterium sp. NIES-65]
MQKLFLVFFPSCLSHDTDSDRIEDLLMIMARAHARHAPSSRLPLSLAAFVVATMLCDWPCDLSSKTASTVVSALEGAAGMEHAMSLYRFPLSILARSPSPFPSPLPPHSPPPSPPLSPFTQTHPQAWADAYGLSADSLLPPSPLSLPPSLPPAPHLEDCAALTALRQQAEQRGERGELPPWADPQPAQEGVRGAQEGGAQGEVGLACCKRAASGEASGEFKASLTVGAEAGASASPPLPTCCTCVPQPPWVLRIGRQCSENWSGAEGCVQMTALRSSSRLLLFPSSPRLLVYSSPHFFVSGALGLGVTWAGARGGQ